MRVSLREYVTVCPWSHNNLRYANYVELKINIKVYIYYVLSPNEMESMETTPTGFSVFNVCVPSLKLMVLRVCDDIFYLIW